jgi:Tol biopolymer transport system component
MIRSNQDLNFGHITYIGPVTDKDGSRSYNLYLMDGDGNRTQNLDFHVNGPAAWSHDGRYIAYGCMKNTHICIIDSNNVIDYRKYPLLYDKNALTLASPNQNPPSIQIPDNCKMPENASPFGFHSLSWSSDNTKFAVVCGDGRKANVVCIVPLDGKATCWDKDVLEYPIEVATWSPRDDLLAVSGSGGGIKPSIYLMDEKGKIIKYLVDGWSPAFSSDGKKIAYFKWADNVKWDSDGKEVNDDQIDFAGISIINIDGSGERWVHVPLSPNSTSLEIVQAPSPYCETSWTCKITWSPDNRYLAFSANSGTDMDVQIYRLEIRTGEIVYLTYHLSNMYSSPDWGQ